MRNLFKIWLAIGGILFLGAFVSNSKDANENKKQGSIFTQKMNTQEANIVVEKVYQLNGLVRTEIQLDTTQFGVCDTCMGSFTSVLNVNRKLVDSLTVENSKLFERYEKTIELNYQLDKVKKSVEKQIEMSNKLLTKK